MSSAREIYDESLIDETELETPLTRIDIYCKIDPVKLKKSASRESLKNKRSRNRQAKANRIANSRNMSKLSENLTILGSTFEPIKEETYFENELPSDTDEYEQAEQSQIGES